ncbi:PEP/pyruvate-binding domain-containing protein [Actinomycetospora flava]|uniref:Phosphoenolpyruvate synthase n=1 Tax=Actinomycetospora flava TaxID=3129232 RepID=A0ABU8M406_9PSEU
MTVESVLAAVVRSRESLWTDRAIDERARQGIAPEDVRLAVVIQRMADAEASGVLFTAERRPGGATGSSSARRGAWASRSSAGLGARIVEGEVTAMTQTRGTTRSGEPDDDVPPVPQRPAPRVPEHEVPELGEDEVPEVARDEVPETPETPTVAGEQPVDIVRGAVDAP